MWKNSKLDEGGNRLNDEKKNYGRIRVCFCNNLQFVLYGRNPPLLWVRVNWVELYKGDIVTQLSPKNYSKGKVCPFGGQSFQTVIVHGHEQYVVCKTNLEPFCQGKNFKSGRDG